MSKDARYLTILSESITLSVRILRLYDTTTRRRTADFSHRNSCACRLGNKTEIRRNAFVMWHFSMEHKHNVNGVLEFPDSCVRLHVKCSIGSQQPAAVRSRVVVSQLVGMALESVFTRNYHFKAARFVHAEQSTVFVCVSVKVSTEMCIIWLSWAHNHHSANCSTVVFPV